MKFLIYGKTGWIGGLLGEVLAKEGHEYEYGEARLEDRPGIDADIARCSPDRVVCAAGVTGRPNVDWCEDNRQACVRGNVIGPLNLADACDAAGVHMTYFGTGCIFEYCEGFEPGSGRGFSESDAPNFTGSYYSRCKAAAEELLGAYPGVLTLRIRMPIVGDLACERNFVSKIMRYRKVVDVPNSMTVLPELLPLSVDMSARRLTGVMNLTNPGAVGHNEVLGMYRDLVDPDFRWENFSLEEQAAVIKAPRSNNELDTSRLVSEYPGVLGVRESLVKHVFEPLSRDADRVRAMVGEMRGL